MLSNYFPARDLSACPIRRGAFPSASAGGKPPLPGDEPVSEAGGIDNRTNNSSLNEEARDDSQAKQTWQELQMLRQVERAGNE